MPLSRSEARLVFPRHPVNGAHTCVRRRAGRPRTCVRSPCPYVHSFKHTSTSLYVARSERAASEGRGNTTARKRRGSESKRRKDQRRERRDGGDLCRGEKRGRQEGGKVEGGNSSGVGEDAMPRTDSVIFLDRAWNVAFPRADLQTRRGSQTTIAARVSTFARDRLRTYRSFNRPMTRTRTRTGFTEAAYILARVRCTL